MLKPCENPVAHAMAHTSVVTIGESAIARIVTRGVNPEAVGICACLVHLRRPCAGESRPHLLEGPGFVDGVSTGWVVVEVQGGLGRPGTAVSWRCDAVVPCHWYRRAGAAVPRCRDAVLW